MKRILITGGAGFVGSSLAIRLRSEYPEATIVCLDNLYRKGAELNRDRLANIGVLFVKADVRDPGSFDQHVFDLVIDAAAEPSVMAGVGGSNVKYVVDTNLVGTLNILEAVRRWNAALVFLSSSRVYPVERLREIALIETGKRFELAESQELPGVSVNGISEHFPMNGSRTLYGATKYASEIMVMEYAAQFGVRTVVDRCGVIAGPWQMGKVDQGVVALWVAAHHYGRSLTYIGYGGRQVRDAVHIDDLADLIVRQLEDIDRWNGGLWCVGGGRKVSFSLLELTETVAAATGKRIDMRFDDNVRQGDVPIFIADARRVADSYGWIPARGIDRIVGDTARWVHDNDEHLRDLFC